MACWSTKRLDSDLTPVAASRVGRYNVDPNGVIATSSFPTILGFAIGTIEAANRLITSKRIVRYPQR